MMELPYLYPAKQESVATNFASNSLQQVEAIHSKHQY